MMSEGSFAEGYAIGRDSTGGAYGNGMFGGDWAWWIIILLIFGWGGNGFGFGGNGGFMNGALTRSDLCQDMNFNDLQSGVRNINDAVNVGFSNLNSTICHQQYDTAGLINGVSTAMLEGFNTMNIANLQSANAIQAQIAQCCCDARYEAAQNTCGILNAINNNTRDIVASQQAGTQRIIDYLCDKENQSLRDENFALRLSASQEKQNAYLVNQLGPKSPIPAYPVFPTTSFAYPTGVSFGINGYGSGCGCGTSIQ